MNQSLVLLAAGGTGGHLFPAEALGRVLARRGVKVGLVTDHRAQKYGGQFPGTLFKITSGTPTKAGIVAKVDAGAKLSKGMLQAFSLLLRHRPQLVIGFGGYPTVPPLLAASLLGIPTILHEQNAVIGRANRFLAGRVKAIACGFDGLEGISADIAAKVTATGNPVRPSVLEASHLPYPDFGAGKLNLLVTGGSQGAKVMADVVPAAIYLLNDEERRRLSLVQQARGEDRQRVTAAYLKLGFCAEVKEFFDDLPLRIAQAHLVIARSGASTVSELAVIGRASILVPFPFALDQDQAANAAELAKSGSADIIAQSDFTPQWLAQNVRSLLQNPQFLLHRAEQAKSVARPEAAESLADLVLTTIRN